MKRDMDLIRALLLEIEGGKRTFVIISRSDAIVIGMDESEGMDDNETAKVEYHLNLIQNAGFVEFDRASGGHWFCDGLTWYGHEFLEDIKDDTLWDDAKTGAKEMGGLSMEILRDLIKGLVKTKVKQHTGIDV